MKSSNDFEKSLNDLERFLTTLKILGINEIEEIAADCGALPSRTAIRDLLDIEFSEPSSLTEEEIEKTHQDLAEILKVLDTVPITFCQEGLKPLGLVCFGSSSELSES